MTTFANLWVMDEVTEAANGTLCYLLRQNASHNTLSFHCSFSPGEIINWVALDYEQQVQHHLIALVTDHGVPQLNATVSVYISVMDLNDNRPCFSQDLLRFKVCKIYKVCYCAGLRNGFGDILYILLQ